MCEDFCLLQGLARSYCSAIQPLYLATSVKTVGWPAKHDQMTTIDKLLIIRKLEIKKGKEPSSAHPRLQLVIPCKTHGPSTFVCT